MTIRYLLFITTPARAGGHTTLSTTTASAPVTTESTAATATTTIAALAVSAAVALNLMEAIVGVGSGTRFSWLWVVVSPRLVAGRDRGSGLNAALGLGGLLRRLNVNPLLRNSQIVAGIPLALTSSISSAVSDIGGWDAGGSNGLLRVSIGQSNVGTFLDFGKRGVRDSRVGLNRLLRLNLGFGSLGCSLWISISDSKLLNLGICIGLVSMIE